MSKSEKSQSTSSEMKDQPTLKSFFKRKIDQISEDQLDQSSIINSNMGNSSLKKTKTNNEPSVSLTSSTSHRLSFKRSMSKTKSTGEEQLPENQDDDADKQDQKEPELSFELRTKYMNRYKFLSFDGKKLYCRLCKDAGFSNVLSNGKQYLRDTNIDQHLTGKDHEKAIMIDDAKNNPNSHLIEGFLNCKKDLPEDELMPLFRNIYWLSHNDVALAKSPTIHELADANKVQQNPNYRNEKAGREITLCIGDNIRADILNQIKESPFIGLSFDESTDISSESHLSLCIKYTQDHQILNTFIQLFSIDKKDAESIFQILLKFLIEHSLLSRVNSISTDGASVLKSLKNGVSGKFKKIIPDIFTTHCIAHRLALGVRCLKKNEDFVLFDTTVHRLISFVSASGKRLKILTEYEEQVLDINLQLLKPHKVRWLSHYAVLKRIKDLYPALVLTLDEIAIKEKDVLASSLMTCLLDFKFVARLHILCDILSIVDKPMRLFQGKHVSINEYLLLITKCITSLDALYAGDDLGVHLNDLYTQFDILEREWRGLYFTYNENDQNQMRDIGFKISQIVTEELRGSFPDNKILDDFKILEIPYLKQLLKPLPKDQIGTLGNDAVRSCIKYYNTFLKRRKQEVILSEQNFRLDETEALAEWRELKIDIKTNLINQNEEFILKGLIGNLSYPNLTKVYQFLMAIPLSTAECERSFSRMNLIKTRLRNCLANETLDHHMVISLLGPELASFDPIGKKSIEDWKNLKNRYHA